MIVAKSYIDGFHIEGHAGEGNDIVCSAVSFLSQSIIHYLAGDVEFHIEDGTTDMTSANPHKNMRFHVAMGIFDQGMVDLQNSYPDFVQYESIFEYKPAIAH